MDLLSFFVVNGIEHRVASRGQEVVVKYCPFCRNFGVDPYEHPYHLYVNRYTGKFHCKICNSAGDFSKLKDAFGIVSRLKVSRPQAFNVTYDDVLKWHMNLLGDEEAKEYLFSRRISPRTIKHFRLGVTEKYGRKVIAIPYFHPTQRDSFGKRVVVAVKYRALSDKVYFAETGSNLRDFLFNHEILLDDNVKEVVITEGEMDALSLFSVGYENVLSLSSGVSHASSGDFIDDLKKKEKVVICFDNDSEGRKAVRELAKRLDYKCVHVKLPNGFKDLNEYFTHKDEQGNYVYDLNSFLSLKQEEVHIENVVPLSKAVEVLYDDEVGEPVLFQIFTPWENMNAILRNGKGITEGDLVIMSGFPKVGKTTLLIQWTCYLARIGIPVLFYCLEMKKRKLVPKFISAWLREEYLEDPDQILQVKESDPPIYIVDSSSEKSQKEVFELIREAVKRYGIKVVVFDNLHFLVSGVSNVQAEVASIIKKFKLLAEELSVAMFVVAHVTKKVDESNPPTSSDLRDSGMIRANADYVFVLHRKRIAREGIDGSKIWEFDENAILVLDTCRYGDTGHIALKFYPTKNYFEEVF